MNTSFVLHPVPPFRLDYTIWALRRIQKNIIDQWNGTLYTRLFVIDNKPMIVTVRQTGTINVPEIIVSTNKKINQTTQNKLTQILEMMLGLKYDLHDFYQLVKKDSRLNELVIRFAGLKPPRFQTLFEALVNAISCQQISIEAGLQIQNHLAQLVGMSLFDKDKVLYAFPQPAAVANCSINELKKTGYSERKSTTLIRLASSIVEHPNLFEGLEEKSNNDISNILGQYKGIGRWTIEYVLLRGLGRIEIFPGDDIGAQNNLQKIFHFDSKPDYQKISIITAKWHPYAGLIYFHLLIQKLHEKGLIHA